MNTTNDTPIVPIRPVMELGALPKSPAAASPADRLVSLGDMLIMVQRAKEETEETGQPFADCLVDVICDQLAA